MDRGKTAQWVAILIAVVWTVSFVADLLLPRYDPPASVQAALVLALGFLFGSELTGRKRND